jgi:hypothetical protein
MKENNLSPGILYSAKISFKINAEIKIFHNKQKLKQHMTTTPPLHKILKEILHTEDENKHNHGKTRSITPQATEKYSDNSIELAEYTQTLKQQKQLNGRNYHIFLNTNI